MIHLKHMKQNNNTCKCCGQLLINTTQDVLKGLNYKQIDGIDGDYAITDTGLVYSYKRHNFVKIVNHRVGLLVNKTLKSILVAKLVASHFNPNYKNESRIKYIDGDKNNCNINNLHVF